MKNLILFTSLFPPQILFSQNNYKRPPNYPLKKNITINKNSFDQAALNLNSKKINIKCDRVEVFEEKNKTVTV